MNLFKLLGKTPHRGTVCLIPYGSMKKDGSHDHRTNKGADRTQAQKTGDLKRSKRG
ncbi:hypothetical protein [Paraburkholderia flagellata]|uniref:hypothetical protein n=1 Tax=Paraburkholderia flagellata TaxID=2883241 RepID=UPI001F41B93A|nr:hypothetical protein [Paraburkholderia flagellata]